MRKSKAKKVAPKRKLIVNKKAMPGRKFSRRKKEKIVPGKLALNEKETIIVFNLEDTKAEVFTYDISWQKQLEKKFKAKPIRDNGWGGKSYKIDKHVFDLKAPESNKESK
jgi:hypothetical protein